VVSHAFSADQLVVVADGLQAAEHCRSAITQDLRGVFCIQAVPGHEAACLYCHVEPSRVPRLLAAASPALDDLPAAALCDLPELVDLVLDGLRISRDPHIEHGEVWWALWPFVGWGVGVVAHGLAVFGNMPNFITRWQLRKIKELKDRM
jgi:2TM domain-containing protein